MEHSQKIAVTVLSVEKVHRLNDDASVAYPSHKVLDDERMHVRCLAEARYWLHLKLHQIVGKSEAG